MQLAIPLLLIDAAAVHNAMIVDVDYLPMRGARHARTRSGWPAASVSPADVDTRGDLLNIDYPNAIAKSVATRVVGFDEHPSISRVWRKLP